MERSVIVAVVAIATLGCAGASKLDLRHFGQRAAWQDPDEVVRALGVHTGDHVVDLGAGSGYFLPVQVFEVFTPKPQAALPRHVR